MPCSRNRSAVGGMSNYMRRSRLPRTADERTACRDQSWRRQSSGGTTARPARQAIAGSRLQWWRGGRGRQPRCAYRRVALVLGWWSNSPDKNTHYARLGQSAVSVRNRRSPATTSKRKNSNASERSCPSCSNTEAAVQPAGKKHADDAFIEKLCNTILQSSDEGAAEAIAGALAEGFAPQELGEAISLASNHVFLRQVETRRERWLLHAWRFYGSACFRHD